MAMDHPHPHHFRRVRVGNVDDVSRKTLADGAPPPPPLRHFALSAHGGSCDGRCGLPLALRDAPNGSGVHWRPARWQGGTNHANSLSSRPRSEERQHAGALARVKEEAVGEGRWTARPTDPLREVARDANVEDGRNDRSADDDGDWRRSDYRSHSAAAVEPTWTVAARQERKAQERRTPRWRRSLPHGAAAPL